VPGLLWILPGAVLALSWLCSSSGSAPVLHWCSAGACILLALRWLYLISCSLLVLPWLCACAGPSLLLYMFCSDILLAATRRCPGYIHTLAPCWLCASFVMILALSWLIPGTVLAMLSIYLCWPFPGTVLAVYFYFLGSWLPLICWAGPWLYLGFAPAPCWYDSDFWLTLLCCLLGFTLVLHWLDFEFWLTLSLTLILAGWSLVLAPAFCRRSTCSGGLAMLFGGLWL
jgi:hypothetical protein